MTVGVICGEQRRASPLSRRRWCPNPSLFHATGRQELGPETDDSRWIYPVPLRRTLQLQHLFIQAADAFDIVLGTLNIRASGAAVGAVRFLAEVHVLISWLADLNASDQEKTKRAYRLVLGNIARVRNMLRRDPANAGYARRFEPSIATLREIASEDGIQHLDQEPRADYLFDTYLGAGYSAFAMMSEIGSHPGFFKRSSSTLMRVRRSTWTSPVVRRNGLRGSGEAFTSSRIPASPSGTNSAGSNGSSSRSIHSSTKRTRS
jgi:hypothetical protein